jgi:hypothetical protein
MGDKLLKSTHNPWREKIHVYLEWIPGIETRCRTIAKHGPDAR